MKAFDKVPHRRLLSKLRGYGISEQLILWIEAFLRGRRQRVVINGTASCWEEVISGVPQGSVLGPILFVIFINDLPDAVLALLLLYADDSKIYKAITSLDDQIDLQFDLQRMHLWSTKWLLSFHPDKLKCLTLYPGRSNASSRSYFIGENRVKKTTMETDLGVDVDQKLSFESHISKKIKKANRMWGAIRRSFRYLDHRTFRLLFKGMVRCHLEVASSVWSPSSEALCDSIEGVQRRATSMLPGMSDKAYGERLRALKLTTLRSRRWRGDMIEVYKTLHKVYEPIVAPSLTLRADQPGRAALRQHPLTLLTQRSNNRLRQNVFNRRVIPVWNCLSDNSKDAPSVDAFKARIDREWANEDILYDHKAKFSKLPAS